MKEYIRFFRIPFIIVGILAIVTIITAVVGGKKSSDALSVMSQNTERLTTERVFDYADKLTDAEEEALRSLITEAENETQCDIVIVTLNESLVEYAAQYEDKIGPVSIDKCVMVYADNFYDEHKFGYNEAYGDGVLFLDNWYREADGTVYSWMSTSGRAETKYTSNMINAVLKDVVYYVEDDPYTAYATFVEDFRRDMKGSSARVTETVFQPLYILIAALVIAVIFLIINWSSKKGKRTTTSNTYVIGGNPHFSRREDRFLYKNVTKRKIEKSSSSGGGGGHHRSAGGRSHGGGGIGR